MGQKFIREMTGAVLMDMQRVHYSVVIPTYRGAGTMVELLERLTRVMRGLSKGFEILLVDDCSPDDTWEVIKGLAPAYPELRALRLMTNVGQYAAILCAFEHVRGNFIITMDDDLQQPPEEIPKLIQGMAEHPEMDGVIGTFQTKEHSFWRRLGSSLVGFINRCVSHKPRDLQTTNFRLLRRCLVEAVAAHHTRNPVLGPLILRNTQALINVPVAHHPRSTGRSGYSLYKLIKLTMDHVLNYSTLPLKLVSVVGIVAFLFSFFLGLYYLGLYFITGSTVEVQGWTTLVLLITFFGGLILLSLGLIGEYLIRIIREVNHSPRYVIRERLENNSVKVDYSQIDLSKKVKT
jgi:glycosyltransferase involved in cell wall biosynthesis